jgi:hypothetical protein
MSVTRTLNLSSGNNWVQLADVDLGTAANLNPNSLLSIPDYSVATTLSNPIAAFYIECPDSKPYWTFGGYAKQTISTPLVSGQGFSSVVQTRYRILHKTVTIHFFPTYIQEYGLVINVPWYFKRAFLSVWEYVGDDIDLIYQHTQEILTRI